MPGPNESIFFLLPLISFVLTFSGVGVLIFLLILLTRLVRAVEKIARNFEK